MADERKWIPDIEIENATIKWPWSYFDGREEGLNNKGDYNFIVIIDPDQVDMLRADGWNIKENEPYEEGDNPEYHLKVIISDKFGMPQMFLIKGERKFRVHKLSELASIKRATCEQLDVIISPSFWEKQGRKGQSAYVKEMYVKVIESRFAKNYDDYEEV